MDIEFEMPVVDKNDKPVGKIGKIFMDTWTGKPRKYLVRREVEGPDALHIVSPEQVAEVSAGKVKLNLTIDELQASGNPS